MSLKDILAKELTERQLKYVPTSFDVIGNKEKAVAVIEIPLELKKKKKEIGKAVMQQHKNVRTVLEKASPRSGIFRTRKLKIVAGSRDTEVVHSENGCRFFLDPRKVYFSQRESTERMRMASFVKERETVMVFFAGIGAFPVLISKKASPEKVIGIEINPDAIRYFWKNIKLNKTDNVQIIMGDVKQKANKFYGKCDRVLMPLPEKSLEFLEEAAGVLKNKGMIHLYFFSAENELEEKKKTIEEKIQKGGIEDISKVLPYGPRIWKYRADIVMNK